MQVKLATSCPEQNSSNCPHQARSKVLITSGTLKKASVGVPSRLCAVHVCELIDAGSSWAWLSGAVLCSRVLLMSCEWVRSIEYIKCTLPATGHD